MIHAQKRKVLTGLTLASSLAWMSILPATAVMAQGAPTVTPGSVTLTGPTTSTLNGSTTFTATASDPNGTAEYQFWVEEPNGTWVQAQNYSTNNTFTLSTPSAGDYLVAVEVMDKAQVAAGEWSMAQTTLPDGVFVDSSVTVTSSDTTEVSKGTQVTLTAQASNIFDPLYQFWVKTPSGQWIQSGNYQSSNTWQFTPTGGGTYEYVAYAKSPLAANNPHGALMSNVGTFVAYGTAAEVVATPTTQSVVADGQAPGSVTFTVEDSHGDRVANFSGTLVVNNGGGLEVTDPVTVTSGQAMVSFDVPTTDAGQTFSISADDLTNAVTSAGGISGQGQVANINYSMATAMVSGTAAYSSGLALSASPSSLPNDIPGGGTTSSTVTVSVVDQAGNPIDNSNPYYVNLTLMGSATFSNGSASETLLIPAGHGSTSAVVDVPYGSSGNIEVMATPGSGDPLTAATPIFINLYSVTAPDHLAVSSTTFATESGFTATTYTVVMEDAAGQVITQGPGSSDGIQLTSNEGNLVLSTALQSGGTGQGPISSSTPGSSSGLVNGSASFTVENTGVYSTPATLTFADTSDSAVSSVNAAYTYVTGAPEYATTMPNSESYGVANSDYYGPSASTSGGTPYVGFASVTAGETVMQTAQVADYYGNPVKAANQPIYFRIDESNVGSLPNGAQQYHDVYMAMTNAAGQATIPVSILGSAAPGTHVYIETEGSAQSYIENGHGPQCALEYSVPYVVVATGNYATQISSTLAGGTLVAGTSRSGTVAADNIAQEAIGDTPTLIYHATYDLTGDIQITSSNPSVLGVGSVGTATGFVALGTNGTATLPDLVAGLAGTATITVTDLSQPGVAPLTYQYTVAPGSAITTPWIEYQGAQVTPSNPLSLPSNSAVEVQVVNVDVAGNPVPVTGTTPLAVTLPTLGSGEYWKATSSGVDQSSMVVYIQPGQSSANVWIVSSSATTFTDSSAYDTTAYMVTAITATTESTAGDVNLSWTNPTGVTPSGYQIWVIPFSNESADFAAAYDDTSANVTGEATSATVTGLASGTYEFNVDAMYSSPPAVVKGVPAPSSGLAVP